MAFNDPIAYIALDMSGDGIPPVVYCKQGDTARTLQATIYRAGVEYVPSIGSESVSFRFQRPDGYTDSYPCSVDDFGYVIAQIPPEALWVSGTVRADIAVSCGDRVLSTMCLRLSVEASPTAVEDGFDPLKAQAFTKSGKTVEVTPIKNSTLRFVSDIHPVQDDGTFTLDNPQSIKGYDQITVTRAEDGKAITVKLIDNSESDVCKAYVTDGTYDWTRRRLTIKSLVFALKVSEMNYQDNYPGWKIESMRMRPFTGTVKQIDGVGSSLATLQKNGYLSFSWYDNIRSAYPSLRTDFTNFDLLTLSKSGSGMTQAQWIATYPDLVYQLHCTLNTPMEIIIPRGDVGILAISGLNTFSSNVEGLTVAGLKADESKDTPNESEDKPNTVTLGAPWDTVIHRGWVAGAKENTIPAFYLTKENGYAWAECDVRFSSDGVPVLAHDSTITSEDGATVLTIAESTVEQLKAVTLETSERFGAIKLATLEELLNMARLIDLGVLIDLKAGPADQLVTLAQVVLSSGWASHVIYMPISTTNAQVIQGVDKNASFDFVSRVTTVDDLPSLAPYQALLTGANTVGFDFAASVTDADGGFSADLAAKIRAAGLSVSFWNIRATAYATYMDAGPLRITKQNAADNTNLDAMYLNGKTFW